jgi:hypothetical protein
MLIIVQDKPPVFVSNSTSPESNRYPQSATDRGSNLWGNPLCIPVRTHRTSLIFSDISSSMPIACTPPARSTTSSAMGIGSDRREQSLHTLGKESVGLL